jgi:hypothetical protein
VCKKKTKWTGRNGTAFEVTEDKEFAVEKE